MAGSATIRIAVAGPARQSLYRRIIRAHTTLGPARLFPYGPAARPFQRPVAQYCLVEFLPRIVQPAPSVSDGWRTRLARTLFAPCRRGSYATQRAVRIGHVFSFLFMMVGMLMGNWWLVMIGSFLFVGAQLEERSAVFQSVLQSVRLEEVMLTDFATLSPADTLEDALEKAVHTLQDDFPVVRGSDMVGVVSKQKDSRSPALRRGNGYYVQAVMNRIFDVAAKQESLASAFRKLSARNLSIIPVVDEQRLVGIVTLQNLMHSMALLAETRKLRRQALDS